MDKFYTIKDAVSYTATYTGNEDVFEYMVCWKENNSFAWEWKRKTFAQKIEAKKFAKARKKECRIKPYPYIYQSITVRRVFRDDVECEFCDLKFKTPFERELYTKFIK